MERAAVDRVDLDAVDEDRLGLLAVDRQVDQGVRAGVLAQQVELVGVDGHVARGLAVAVHDGRQPAGLAQAVDVLAGDLAVLGGQRRAGGGHGVGTSGCDRFVVRAAARRRGRSGEAPGAGAQGTTSGGPPRPCATPRRRRCREGASTWRAHRVASARASNACRALTRAESPRITVRAMAATILIVEDEHAVARGIQYALQQEGYEVPVARSGEEGLEIATREAPDLVVLDVRLPGIDGFEVLRRIRAAGAKMPILVLTARDDEVDKVIGLELGADDYLTKPFGLRELMSRIKALLRRSYGDLADAGGGRVIRHRDLVIDLERRRVQRGARRISLTPTEFEILRHLASRPGPRLHPQRAARAAARLRGARPGREDDQRPRQPPAREDRGRPGHPGVRPDGPWCRLRLRRALTPAPTRRGPGRAAVAARRRAGPRPPPAPPAHAPDVPGPADRRLRRGRRADPAARQRPRHQPPRRLLHPAAAGRPRTCARRRSPSTSRSLARRPQVGPGDPVVDADGVLDPAVVALAGRPEQTQQLHRRPAGAGRRRSSTSA